MNLPGPWLGTLTAARDDLGATELCHEDGWTVRMRSGAWYADADPVDERMLARCIGPTVDLGCGPGRLAAALTRRRVPTLGVDLSRDAVALTRARGVAVVCRDVFEPMPGEGLWACGLLADGNVGIGGDPGRLLRRLGRLLTPAGRLVVEVEPRSVRHRGAVRVRLGDGTMGDPFPWAVLGQDALTEIAAAQGWTRAESWQDGGRAFVVLTRAADLECASVRGAATPAAPPATG